MEYNRVFRFTEDDIDRLRDAILDESFIEAYAKWVKRKDELDSAIRKIEEAFAGVTLGDGIGLLEADGIDDYAGDNELADLRARDERTDWRRIHVEVLNECYTAPTFMDARGFIFHLPAFLIAELNDNFNYGFIDRLFDANRLPDDWIPLLNTAQRDAIAAVLGLVIEHPDYLERADEIRVAITKLRESAG